MNGPGFSHHLLGGRREPGSRVDRTSVHPDLEVEMGSGGHPGGSDAADLLTRDQPVALRHRDAGQVSVEGDRAEVVPQDDVQPVAGRAGDHCGDSVGIREHRRPERRCKVDAGVEMAGAAPWRRGLQGEGGAPEPLRHDRALDDAGGDRAGMGHGHRRGEAARPEQKQTRRRGGHDRKDPHHARVTACSRWWAWRLTDEVAWRPAMDDAWSAPGTLKQR